MHFPDVAHGVFLWLAASVVAGCGAATTLAWRRAQRGCYLRASFAACGLAAALLALFALLAPLARHAGAPDAAVMLVKAGLLLGAGLIAGLASTTAGERVRIRRGARVEETGRTSPRVRRAAHDEVSLAGVALAAQDESRHVKIIGTTGTGKTTAIRELLRHALARGDRAVIADPDAGYLEEFHDPARGDVVLGPFDPRAGHWDLFRELEHPYHVEQLARALVPEADGAAREWAGYARTFLASVLHQLHAAGADESEELYRLLMIAGTEELRILVANTPAQPLLEPGNERMFGSVRAVTASAVGALGYLYDQPGRGLAIRDWLRNGSGALYLPYQADQIAALRAIVSAWMRLAIFNTLSLRPVRGPGERRIWFVVDELDALGAIDGLKDALARLRKFGGRCVLGFQSIAQVSSTYGPGDAQTIVENCANTLILRCSASEHGGTAQFASRLIGEREVVREQLSNTRTRGWFEPRQRTVSRTAQVATESAVLPAEIEQLADLNGFLKTASRPAWLRVALDPAARPIP